MLASAIQLTLGLHQSDQTTFSNFYLGRNVETILALQQVASGQGERSLYLYGTAGQGCSHLLQACNHYAYQHQLSSVYLPLAQLLPLSPEILLNLESLMLVCIDDIQLIAGHVEWEEAIFHLYNRVYDANGRLIIAAHTLPKMINLKLPDLGSRLSWSVLYSLVALTDDEKRIVLIQRAKQRGIHLAPEIAHYILQHCPRQMNVLCGVLDTLDQASLAAKRRLTIPFVKEVLRI